MHGSVMPRGPVSSAPVLEVEHLVKRYRDVTALTGVSLTIGAGEIFALLGPNGAGKTTLIGAVCGLVKKTSGTIRLFGVDLDREPLRPRYDVGLVPQEVNFDPFFTVSESLRIQLGYYARPPDEARIREVLEALSLDDKADAQTRALSGGMKRRLLIAKALVHRPKLVFLDEPTAGVDVELRRDLWAYVRRLRSQGTTVILTTHYLEEAETLCRNIAIISGGRIVERDRMSSLLRRLHVETFVFNLRDTLAVVPPLAGYVTRLVDDHTLEVEVSKEENLNDIFARLSALGIEVLSMRNKVNRLEEIFMRLVEGGRTADAGEPVAPPEGEAPRGQASARR
jgi:ABC-2 type transport system ATP-binding protein